MTHPDRKPAKNRTLLELCIGIGVFGCLCGGITAALPLRSVKLYSGDFFSVGKFEIGLWCGILLAIAGAVQMNHSLQRSLDRDEKSAARLMASSFVVRYLVAIGALCALQFTGVGYPLAGFLGVMGMKAGAYLTPLTHKVFNFLLKEYDPPGEALPEEPTDDSDDKSENMSETSKESSEE